MKLLDLVREHLSEWPDDKCVAITQDYGGDNGVYYWRLMPYFNTTKGEWINRNNGTLCGLLEGGHFFMVPKDDPDASFSLCEDYETAIITREQFEAYKMKPDDKPTVTTTGLIEWRDRIIQIEKTQIELQEEKRDLYSKINQSGFNLNLNAMKK